MRDEGLGGGGGAAELKARGRKGGLGLKIKLLRRSKGSTQPWRGSIDARSSGAAHWVVKTASASSSASRWAPQAQGEATPRGCVCARFRGSAWRGEASLE